MDTPEIPKSQGMQMFSLEDGGEIIDTDEEKGFQGRDYHIGDLGLGNISGTFGATSYNQEDIGIALDNNSVIKGDAEKLSEKYTPLNVSLRANMPFPPFKCLVYYPAKDTMFETTMSFVEDTYEEPDRRYVAIDHGWEIVGEEGSNYPVLFVPLDPKLLSELRFSFSTDLTPQK